MVDIKYDWEGFFRDTGLSTAVAGLASAEVPILAIQFNQVEMYQSYIADALLDDSRECLSEAESVMRDILGPRFKGKPKLRVNKLPRSERIGIRKIRSDRIGHLIAIEGLVKRATEVRPMIVRTAYTCNACGTTTFVEQYSLVPTMPLCCDAEQGGCGRSASQVKMVLDWEHCEYANVQKLEIQENPETLKGGASPEHLTVYCLDDLTGIVNPGDRVIINGILRPADTGGKLKSNIQEIQLDANSIETEMKDYEELDVTNEEVTKFQTEAKDPDFMGHLIQSIAPSICGYNTEKEAMALQLFGGVEKNLEDGTKIRGDIHVLLVGDPGVAKSALVRYMTHLAPRGVYASGKSTSAAGLIAAAIKDDFGGEGRYTLVAGSMVLADKGLIGVDELDKMTEEDRSAMHEALEAQEVHISKAGITATLSTRCSMLAACNPEYGRFDENTALAEQINLPPTLLSRFDFIFAMTDKPNREKDERIARHVLTNHLRGEALKTGNKACLDETEAIRPYYEADFIRKYVAYSKKVTPILTPEASDMILDAYLGIRKKGEGEGRSVPITARQLEAFIRISEASARSRLSLNVEKQDAERAIRIVDYFLARMANEGDIDSIEAQYTRNKRGKIDTVLRTIKASPNPISKMELEEKLDGKVNTDELSKILDTLHQGAKVIESRGKYSAVC